MWFSKEKDEEWNIFGKIFLIRAKSTLKSQNFTLSCKPVWHSVITCIYNCTQ